MGDLSYLSKRRHDSANLLSPRNRSSTIRNFSSAAYFLRVSRRTSRTVASTEIASSAIFCPFGSLIQPDLGRKSHLSSLPQTVSQALKPNSGDLLAK